MSILPCSVFIFIIYIWMHSCNARPSAMLLDPDFAENKVVDKVRVSVDSSTGQGTNVVVAKASMKKAEDYKIGGHVKKMKVNGRKEAKNVQKDDERLGFDSADYSQPRTHPPSHN